VKTLFEKIPPEINYSASEALWSKIIEIKGLGDPRRCREELQKMIERLGKSCTELGGSVKIEKVFEGDYHYFRSWLVYRVTCMLDRPVKLSDVRKKLEVKMVVPREKSYAVITNEDVVVPRLNVNLTCSCERYEEKKMYRGKRIVNELKVTIEATA